MTARATQPSEPGAIDFRPDDFERARTLIRAWAGITLNDTKQTMVFSRLSRRVRTHGQGSFRRYLDRLEEGIDADERTQFINALTTNLTSFFRESYHFPILAEHARRCAAEGGRALRIWCSAASTGEEPYSIAITVREALGIAPARDVRILATDIDTEVLAHAAAGVYAAERVAALPREQLREHFHKGCGSRSGFVRVQPGLREMVEFRQLNLLDARWPIERDLDAIFCRNVMIYFDKPTQAAVLARMLEHLRPGGLFFAGHSENFQSFSPRLRACGKTVYRWLSAADAGLAGERRGAAA
jgi:chemotaxis protein methyltransferase CheR